MLAICPLLALLEYLLLRVLFRGSSGPLLSLQRRVGEEQIMLLLEEHRVLLVELLVLLQELGVLLFLNAKFLGYF